MLIALVIFKLLLSFGKTQRERGRKRKKRERESILWGCTKTTRERKVSGQYTGRCFAYVNEISLKWKNKQTKKMK